MFHLINLKGQMSTTGLRSVDKFMHRCQSCGLYEEPKNIYVNYEQNSRGKLVQTAAQ